MPELGGPRPSADRVRSVPLGNESPYSNRLVAPHSLAAAAAAAAPRSAAARPIVQPSPAAGRPDSAGFYKLEIRVGRIQCAWPHEQSDKLFCEEVDVGEEAPRTIASGLRAYYSTEAMQGRNILVVTNLKPRKMVRAFRQRCRVSVHAPRPAATGSQAGFPSQGMVLCAKSEDGTRVEVGCRRPHRRPVLPSWAAVWHDAWPHPSAPQFVEPPAGAVPGELVTVDGLAGRPDPIPNLNLVSKTSPWPAVAPRLRTDTGRVACFDGMPLVVGDRGRCAAPSLSHAPIN